MPILYFRVPDRVFAWLSALVMLMTWALVIWAYPDLPERIPSHFGANGQPDGYSNKSFFSVAFPAILQLLLNGLFFWIYRRPQYASIPSTVLISLMPEPLRGNLFRLIRHMVVVMAVLINLLFAHISLATIGVAFQVTTGLNGWLVGGLIGLLLSYSIFYSVWMYRLVKSSHSVQSRDIEKTLSA